MKKILVFLLVFVAAFGLAACDKKEVTKELPEVITMANIDEFMNHPNTDIVDLRNWQDKMKGGYIRGTHMIPFFQYLESENILVRTDGNWDFAAEDIVDALALKNIFDKDMNIILFCAAGTRAGFVKAALESLGYTKVWNAGAIGDYKGDAKVFGDDKYTLPAYPVKAA